MVLICWILSLDRTLCVEPLFEIVVSMCAMDFLFAPFRPLKIAPNLFNLKAI